MYATVVICVLTRHVYTSVKSIYCTKKYRFRFRCVIYKSVEIISKTAGNVYYCQRNVKKRIYIYIRMSSEKNNRRSKYTRIYIYVYKKMQMRWYMRRSMKKKKRKNCERTRVCSIVIMCDQTSRRQVYYIIRFSLVLCSVYNIREVDAVTA